MNPPACYFAYGSNMNPQRVAARIGETHSAMPGVLKGYELRFDKASRVPGVSHANVVARPGARVEGVLIGLKHSGQILAMDPFEGHPTAYQRHRLPIHTGQGVIDAWVYIAVPGTTEAERLPAREYLMHLLKGEAFLSSAYRAWLAETPCVEGLGQEALKSLGILPDSQG
ncbi:gamma-glutamylcyclotransferase [Halomonas sp. 18H]|nr:gamma-glutamylcyclotransferase family protein [Halomonas sp. 18H]MCW4151528.1 gamma-glutamylcyclotransferase [Halomonas sp. 18H]